MQNTSQNEIIKFEWKEIYSLCEEFCKSNKQDFDCIIAITRGGWIPGVIISHILKIRMVYPLQMYETISDDINAQKLPPKFGVNIDFECIKDKKVLIIDDILGSGATLENAVNFVKSYTKNIKTYVLVRNLNNFKGRFNADYIGKDIRGWAIFPWEKQI